jgi:hypothetical protein
MEEGNGSCAPARSLHLHLQLQLMMAMMILQRSDRLTHLAEHDPDAHHAIQQRCSQLGRGGVGVE